MDQPLYIPADHHFGLEVQTRFQTKRAHWRTHVNRGGNNGGQQYALTDEIPRLNNCKILKPEGVLRVTGICMHIGTRRAGTWAASSQRLVPFDSGTGLTNVFAPAPSRTNPDDHSYCSVLK